MKGERTFTLDQRFCLEKQANLFFREYDTDFVLAEAESTAEGIKAIAQRFGVLAIPSPLKTREHDVEFDYNGTKYAEIKVRFYTLDALNNFRGLIAIEKSKIDNITVDRERHYILNIFLEEEPGIAHAFLHQIDDPTKTDGKLPREQRTHTIGEGATKNTTKYLYDINSPGCIKWDYRTDFCLKSVFYRPETGVDCFFEKYLETIDDLNITNYVTGANYDNL